MLISLNWLRDFVDLPEDLDPHELAEQFTLTCAEVEEVFQIQTGDRTAAEAVAQLNDWIIEVDNKSITHRPDLWGHYGIAREMAAMLQLPLKPLEVADGEELDDAALPEIPIEIDDAQACPRYSAILFEGVRSQPSPALMQGRLINVGIRPIDALVDLSNYIMAEIGQPMHAFDGDRVQKIEVGFAAPGDTFTTLDNVQRKLPERALMILSDRKYVALAGLMGGAASEVSPGTTSILLESANFDAVAIRRCASALGHRTEASTRFEKSLDPANTVLGIARFIHLARQQFPDLKLTSRLSDCFPDPGQSLSIAVDPVFVAALIGKAVPFSRMKDILEAIEFKVEDRGEHIEVVVPSFRATKDIEKEADIIEEIARFVSYGKVEPVLPQATVRHFPPNAMHRLEKRSLQLFCLSEGFHEIHGYIWDHQEWLKQLGYDPGESMTLKNPPTQGQERLQKTLLPGLLRAADLNRREWPQLKLIDIATTFDDLTADSVEDMQHRHLGLLAYARDKKADDRLIDDLKGSLSKWARELFDQELIFSAAPSPQYPWETAGKIAEISLGDGSAGRIAAVPLDLRRQIDPHFAAWSVAVAELNLSAVVARTPPHRTLPTIPAHPTVEIDYSALVDASRAYQEVYDGLSRFQHPLLRRFSFEGSYQGKNLPAGKRSLLLRARIGDPNRTLSDEDIKGFRSALEEYLHRHELEIRGA